jgi:tetratricopeptide (TPR) repeat protein
METREIEDKVLASSDEITLPTYALLGENRNPVFHSQYGVAHIYPYTLQDEIALEPAEVTYRTLILENKYLRVTALPDLGGRVYSVYDKTSNKEVFYKNSIIKFSPLAIRGAFFSGGVEFSFPVAHAPTTAEPVNWDFREQEDGSASIIIGGLEHMSGMRWTVKLTLFPNRCALAQDVQLYNPTPIPGRYHYWTNASLDSDDQTEFIYPLQRVRSYEFAGTSSWPVARLDLTTEEPGLPGMEGVPMWPAERLHEAINFRWEKDMLAQVSIFGRDVTWDYFGAWQHSSNTGYAHFARYQDVSGMKLWSWGRSEVGLVNQTALMDDGSLYAETQCGAMETQLDFDFLPPGKSKKWREWWLPLRDMGGLTCASVDIGARLQLSSGEDETTVNLTIGLCPVYSIPEANIELSIPGERLLKESASISPENPWLSTVEVESKTLANHPISLIVRDAAGQELLNYTHQREPYPHEFSDPSPVSSPETAEDFYQLGLKHENFDNCKEALESYREALRLFGEYGPAHFQLGKMLLRSADFKGARHHFRYSADLSIAAANYYLGLISWYTGDIDQAETHYQSVPTEDPLSSAAQRGLASIALQQEQWEQAIKLLSNAPAKDVEMTSRRTLLAIALIRAGQIREAKQELNQVVEQDPLNLIALNELVSLEGKNENAYSTKLERLLVDDKQYILDLACFYLDIGLPQESLSIIEMTVGTWEYPMVHYLMAYINHLLSKEDNSSELRERAQSASPDLVFPSRLWEIIALHHNLVQNPDDDQAKYFLGNFYYAHQRYQEAIQLWEASLATLSSFDVIHRNLGLAYWQHNGDLELAMDFLEKAKSLNPHNQDLYIHLDDLYKQQGFTEKRAILLEEIKALDWTREDVRKRSLAIMVDLGQYEAALQILTEKEFVPLEMDQSFHWLYVRALLQRAESYIEAGQFEQAIADYQKALEFPPNHGVGKPTTMSNAEILYRLGCAYEQVGKFSQAVQTWQEAASEHHSFGQELYSYVQKSLDKLGRYSELGFEG